MRGKSNKCTMDALVDMFEKTGQHVVVARAQRGLFTLRITDNHLPISKINILYAQMRTFHQAHTRAI